MGIVNLTPDSFYGPSRKQHHRELLHTAENMLMNGAVILDLGAYSSRPGAADISIEEEIERLIPSLRSLHQHFPEAILSIDTFRSEVATRAADEGAAIINDISGGMDDPEMIKTVGKLGLPYVLMHKRGTPATMQTLTNYDHVTLELLSYFQQQTAKCREAGIKDILLDPGFGFAKTLEQNYQLLRELKQFEVLSLPILAGLSRKSMIQKVIDANAEGALNGTTALNMAALLNGASVLRVHDVKEAVETTKLYLKMVKG